jgi:hypothetical protein
MIEQLKKENAALRLLVKELTLKYGIVKEQAPKSKIVTARTPDRLEQQPKEWLLQK